MDYFYLQVHHWVTWITKIHTGVCMSRRSHPSWKINKKCIHVGDLFFPMGGLFHLVGSLFSPYEGAYFLGLASPLQKFLRAPMDRICNIFLNKPYPDCSGVVVWRQRLL